jgi:hypothetical protein
MHQRQLDYILKYMLEVYEWWRPHIDQSGLDVLGRCQSKLEQMFLVGAMFELDGNDPCGDIEYSACPFNRGLWVDHPYLGFPDAFGPSILVIEPQVKDGPLTRDFGIYTNSEDVNEYITERNTAGCGVLRCYVEVDGYGVHKDRRDEDRQRDMMATSPVFRFYEETTDPKQWFGHVMQMWQQAREMTT